jgi:hypothetical protein
MIELGGRRLSDDDVRDLLRTDHPMVERFRLDVQQARPGHNLRFALVIVPRRGVRYRQQRDGRGARVAQADGWSTLDGEERIGQGNRVLWVEGDEVLAENATFFPDQTFSDLGIGSAMYVAQERLYRALGVRRVTLLAVEVGTYAWARQGFAFVEPDAAAALVPALERFLFGHGLPLDGVDAGALRESWDLANVEVAGRSIDGERAGKAFMLRGVERWHGVRRLDDAIQMDVAERSRRETFGRLSVKIEGAPANLHVR